MPVIVEVSKPGWDRLSAPFSLGQGKERGGVKSPVSVCFVGGNPMLLRAEPTKQKTRRAERRGITRAVSPKKIGKEREVMSRLSNGGVR